MTSTDHLTIAIAGTTQHTVMCAEALGSDPRVSVSWVLTPSARPVGRKQTLTDNPLYYWANSKHIPTILVHHRIDQQIREQIEAIPAVDILLVVDFGYLIPDWLLALPHIAPLNIHPSDLPKYRGSSPGQFALLYGEKTSAVTLMIMHAGLDTGDILAQLPFSIEDHWTTTEYYQHAFSLIASQLPELIIKVAARNILPQPQPTESPTPIARRLKKEDGFISWDIVSRYIANLEKKQHAQPVINTASQQATSQLIHHVYTSTHSWPQTITQAVRGLSPWPGVWTLVPTTNGDKRMKILSVTLDGDAVLLEKVQIEGLQPTSFEQVKNQIR